MTGLHKTLLILIVLISSGSLSKAQPVRKNVFEKDVHNYSLDTSIRSVALFKGHFYVLKSNGELFRLNAQSHRIDETFKNNSKEISLEGLRTVNDTLFGMSAKNRFYLDGSRNRWMPAKHNNDTSPGSLIYEDADYKVSATCSGEWGGTLYFYHKKKKKLYETLCTCAINLSKTNDSYLVTASLAHMAGFTHIFEINDPVKLKLHGYKKPKPTEYIGGREVYKVGKIGDDESNSEIGTKRLIDSIGITCAASFNYKSQTYFLIERHGKASIDVIDAGRLVALDNFSDTDIEFGYTNYQSAGNQPLAVYENKRNAGFIYFGDNKFHIYNFTLTK